MYLVSSICGDVCVFLLLVSAAQQLVLECEARTTSGHIDIDCKTNRPPQTTLCSFNGGLKHQCMQLSLLM